MDELEDPAKRFVWFGFLLLAGDCPFEGYIKLTEDIGYTDEQLAAFLKVEPSLIAETKPIMEQFDKIKLQDNNIIKIVNWKKYQSEYSRQKSHRDPEFIKMREQIKERDDFTCQECFKHESDLKIPLCIHHIDNDPTNNIPQNLITLCMRCHAHLLKRNVHKSKTEAIKVQEDRFKRKVQEKGSTKIRERLDKEKDKKKIKNNMSKKAEKSFEILRTSFPAHRRGKRQYCFMKFKAICKKGKKEEFRQTTIGYFEYLKDQKLNHNFEQEPMGLSTWMNNWEGDKELYFGFEYKPKL